MALSTAMTILLNHPSPQTCSSLEGAELVEGYWVPMDGTTYERLGHPRRALYQREPDGTTVFYPDTGEIEFLPHYCAEVRRT